jgi:hypothetical protein
MDCARAQAGCNSCLTDLACCAPHELTTLVLEPYPCGGGVISPCMDPIFGQFDREDPLWSSTSESAFPHYAWIMSVDTGGVIDEGKDDDIPHVRAVRGP